MQLVASNIIQIGSTQNPGFTEIIHPGLLKLYTWGFYLFLHSFMYNICQSGIDPANFGKAQNAAHSFMEFGT